MKAMLCVPTHLQLGPGELDQIVQRFIVDLAIGGPVQQMVRLLAAFSFIGLMMRHCSNERWPDPLDPLVHTKSDSQRPLAPYFKLCVATVAQQLIWS